MARRAAGEPPRRLCRHRSRHQQLPPAGGASERRRLHRGRRLLAHRPTGRGTGPDRAAQPGGDGPRSNRAGGLLGQAQAAQGDARPLGRDRGLSPRRERRRVHRPGPRGDRDRAGDHPAGGRGAARGARLPQAAGPWRRPGADLRHRRRLDRAGAGRAGRPDAADQGLVERAVGRRLPDRKRRPRGDRGARPAVRLQPHARAGQARLRPVRRGASARRGRHPPARHQRHRHHARQRPPRAAQLRPPGDRRAPGAVPRDARDQHHHRRDGLVAARQPALHRPRARRPGGGRLRHSRSDPRHLAGRASGRRRSRHPRGDPAQHDGPRRLRPVTRLRSAKGRKVSSTRWLERQLNDPYVKRAKAEGYRSRAAYKLIELDEKFGLLRGVRAAIDLGIAPGGWSQVVRKKAPAAKVAGIDLLPTDPIDGVAILQMDFMADEAPERLREALDGLPVDLVLSDMAANTVGHPQTDHLRTMALVETGLEFAREVLRPGGAYVAKVLAGGTDNQLLAELKRHFATVRHAKPPASRKDSSERYVVAQGFKGRAEADGD
ncbi:RlmE family RNA methyltransferase [Sphingomonas ginkgonis]|uniref:Ribosomal RNA large subunit methyltransferase E n=1 Tax=Sphingomonas ginkgonis TaxID=2315330 RepID=A0A3S0EPT8_9SPHN|nr:RlmE family RNA methyltransferase [Sphingomonas ginkgonis]